MSALGLVVVDEEHDTSYKQDESPRYHGRDVAIVRGAAGRRAGRCSGRRRRRSRRISTRARDATRWCARAPHPRSAAGDGARRRHARGVRARRDRTSSSAAPLREALAARLDAGEQSLMLLNRRGYAAALFCRAVRGHARVPATAASRSPCTAPRAAARCHYCDYDAAAAAERARRAAASSWSIAAFGTERIEAEVRARCPEARVARVDRDTVAAARRDRPPCCGASRARELDVLVGTQMIAKGHDFPGGDAGRRRLRRHRPRRRRLPRRRTHVPAADAGRRPRRPRHASGRGDHPDAVSASTTASALPARQDYAAFFEAELDLPARRCTIRRRCRW